MKLFSLLILGLVSMSFSTEPTVTEKPLDTEKSQLTWKAYKVTGSHEGTLNLKSGSLDFDDTNLVGGSFTVDMNSIACTDLQAGMGKEKLEGHLKSPDFFGVEDYPEATFVIDNVASRGANGDYRVSGNITIKKILNP